MNSECRDARDSDDQERMENPGQAERLLEELSALGAAIYFDTAEVSAWEPPTTLLALQKDLIGKYIPEKEFTWRKISHFRKLDGIWYFDDRVAIPQACPLTKQLVMRMYHDNPSI